MFGGLNSLLLRKQKGSLGEKKELVNERRINVLMNKSKRKEK